MKASNVTQDDLRCALSAINLDRYNNNIRLKRLEPLGRRQNFTLTVNDSAAAGGRIGHSGRRVAAACWHVHGHFFEALFDIAPDAIIKSNMATITQDAGNWCDRNIGSLIEPMYYSDACKCE